MDDNNPNNINTSPEMSSGTPMGPEPMGDNIENMNESSDPINNPDPMNNPEPMNNMTPPPSISPEPVSSGDIVFTDKPKKSKAGLIIGLTAGVLILGGAGGFIAAYAINNQPENIIASSMNKLATAKNVSASGTINLDLDENTTGIDKATITMGAAHAGTNENGNLGIAVTLADGTEINNLSIGESFMNDGTIYLRFDGLEDLYDSYLSRYLTNFTATTETVSLNADAGLDSTYTTTTVTASPMSSSITSFLSDAVSRLDGQWFKISVNDITNSDLLSSMDSSQKQQIENTYNCVVNLMSNGSTYAKEMTDLYSQHKFINMTAGQDSYYNISLSARPLTDYLNALPRTNLFGNLTSCLGATNVSTTTLNPEDVEDILGQLPSVSAKFDGFMDHTLTAMKISQKTDMYDMNADIKITYPDNLSIPAPTDATPIMERVEELVNEFSALNQSQNESGNQTSN